ncbi:sulfur carrier protein ThiS adenylyltransferase ThiF [Lentilactobacillus buchneri]|uniref:Adenylyltransferase n=1 Tax=Lentilactobacillus buchneri subsp. silagei CD034 TaxID=1071400 RepID=J9W6N6_LENBU|nr:MULTISPECIES: sulfur carrier protein ThiS adenylyltransferase ThiF [Lentilactobacillus]MCC6101430.1 sulfur carrier protein ThiS adenylyltransferase ThiF [Lactobacillus sp.]AFS01247.1 adenylyltransferase [Lentilactobacillus buchneri subsp. silagei CD034]MCT2901269.1 sulfur carrier protein ThiS adenylyltransferase ThiF [Lentilactobacillus buchneri]MCT3541655.1 sulfur carrier protein ThiS adenylyltransferase ThiF [Lentilactobacillus buchneri]MCT3543954.1 sulfur carrier protein ThiS adenylyltra
MQEPEIQGMSYDDVYLGMKERNVKGSTDKLAAAHITIAGAGGLGSNIAIALTRIGVGHLTLIDFDTVELSNLNRQQFKLSQVDMPKVVALKQNLQEFNPFVEINIHQTKVTHDNVKELFQDADIITEAFDNPAAKAMLLDAASEFYPDKPIVMGTGMAGIHSSNTITTKHPRKNLYIAGDGESMGAEGLMAPRVMIAAGHEANMITRLILGDTEI